MASRQENVVNGNRAVERAADNPWPDWPLIKRTDYGHEEAARRFGVDPRRYALMTTAFVDNGQGGGER